MTKPCYPSGCAAGSEVSGAASPAAYSPGDYAWYVNFNNGNSNWNNQDNNGFVRACRASECQDAVSLEDLHAAWREAHRAKKPSRNQLAFDAEWMDRLIELQVQLSTGTWRPSPPVCFIAEQPKAREIHAPDFADRVVHHWLVPQLEAIYERGFIFDSYSNRRRKGTHAAVERLRHFVRQVDSGQGGGWYLQLDIANFFNSIHRPTLYTMLKTRMERYGLSMPIRRAVHALLAHSPTASGVIYACSPEEHSRVPAHKKLANAAPGCGITIGNLSSQFFANVYLDALDQHVKHELRCERYLRYVDDFVLVHRNREQLEAWRSEIVRFLADRLRLTLRAESRPRGLRSGIDFLGYVIYPTHTSVRRRVVRHLEAVLRCWNSKRARRGRHETIRSVWASYLGHFSHANAWRLRRGIESRFPWLTQLSNSPCHADVTLRLAKRHP